MKLILASASPRRRELLEQIGLEFVVFPAQGEEFSEKEEPQEFVVELASKKAGEVYERTMAAGILTEESLVLGADTIVVLEGRILGKPKDAQDAVRMLSLLSGNTHEVYTGVSLWMCEHGKKMQYSFYGKTAVTMYPMTEQEKADYVKSGEPLDKAGAYGIQGLGAKFIQKIDGDYNNVVGLPIAQIYQKIMQLGIAISPKSV